MPEFEEIKINTSKLKTEQEYVCWIDTMGTKNTMSESFEKAANFMIRFHSYVIESIQSLAKDNRISYYPVMDGIYLTSPTWEDMKKVIDGIYKRGSNVFVNESTIAHRFIIRGAIAYGTVAHGESITKDVCPIINTRYKEKFLMGMPMIQAFTSECYAPPYGMFIHESARQVKILQGRYYQWAHDNKMREKLQDKINQYFLWCKEFRMYLGMDENKILQYIQLNKEHLNNLNCKEDEVEE